MSKKKCPNCYDGTLIIKYKNKESNEKDKPLKIQQLDVKCTSCGDDVLKHLQSKSNKQISRDLYSEINGLLTSAEVRKIRKQLNLTQKAASKLCGGGPNAFSRYERGKATPLRSTSNLLRLLSRHPEEVEYLKSYCN